jgi:SAM-dependent methyltransferase
MFSTNYVRRKDYGTASPQDEFIVSLLRHHIEEILPTYAKSSSLNPRALDVGCGSQPFRKNLEILGYTYTSIDAEQNPENSVDVVCRIDQPLPSEAIANGTFDFILCTEVMEHVVDWNMAFSNFSQLLTPEGRLFITCPYFYPLHEEPYDFWRATPYTLQHFGNKFGLKILYQVNAGDGWDVLGTLLGSIYSEPKSHSLGDRIFSKVISLCQKVVLKLLLARFIQRFAHLKGKLYLANIVVFEK